VAPVLRQWLPGFAEASGVAGPLQP